MRQTLGLIGRRWRAAFRGRQSRHLTLAGVSALAIGAAAFGTVTPPSSVGGASPVRHAPTRGPMVRQLPRGRGLPIIGEEVRSATSGYIGQVVGVLVDEAGRPHAAILDVGGFLGIGTRQIAVDWQALRFFVTGQRAVLVADLEPDQLKGAPPYNARGRTIAVVGRSRAGGRTALPQPTQR
jgi:PRC-barrel domain